MQGRLHDIAGSRQLLPAQVDAQKADRDRRVLLDQPLERRVNAEPLQLIGMHKASHKAPEFVERTALQVAGTHRRAKLRRARPECQQTFEGEMPRQPVQNGADVSDEFQIRETGGVEMRRTDCAAAGVERIHAGGASWNACDQRSVQQLDRSGPSSMDKVSVRM